MADLEEGSPRQQGIRVYVGEQTAAAEEVGHPGQVDAPEEEVSLLDLVIVLVSRRRLIAKVVGVTLVLGLLACFLLPARYTATAMILPPQGNSSMAASMMSQLGGLGSMASLASGGALSLKNPNDLQLAILKSRTVEDAMVDRFHLVQLYRTKRQSDARKSFESHATLDSGAKDGLIHISVTDASAQRAAEMTNAYVEEYKRITATLATTEAAQRRLFFEQQLVAAKDALATAEEQLKATEQKTGLIQLDAQSRAVIQSVATLRAQVAAKEVQVQGMRSFATGENPELVQAEGELAALKAQLSKQAVSAGGEAGDLLMPKGSVPQAGMSYVRDLREVKYRETIFDLLARQFEAAKLDEARQGAVVQVVDKAIVPDKRSSPQRTLIMIAALAAGLFLGIVTAFVAEALTRAQARPDDRERMELLKQAWSTQGARGRS